MAVDPLSAVSSGVSGLQNLASNADSKVDDNAFIQAFREYYAKYPEKAKFALQGMVRALGESAAQMGQIPAEDLKARVNKALETTANSIGARLEIEKLKDTKQLDALTQELLKFMETEYGIQSQRASSEIGLDTSARGGVARGTSLLGFLGKIACGFCDVVGMEHPEWAKKWIQEAETYTTQKIKSGDVTHSKIDTSDLEGLDTSRYEELTEKLARMLTGSVQNVTVDMTRQAAANTQQVANSAVAAGTIPDIEAPSTMPSPQATAPAQSRPQVSQVKLDMTGFSEARDEIAKPGIMQRIKGWLSFGDNSADITQSRGASSAQQVAAPKLELQ
ncbi:MAG TPA: hypothetical protein PLK94_07580 [Alphaproteobacteria bacterium]|nr:hypothetical protein [Alphaproteobacteria bacterium]HOO51128.1 hypothetical protein [Alphaproteobacteria bacterium]